MMQLGWDTPSDMWCLGCLLLELYTGKMMFEAKEPLTQLGIWEKLLGVLPKWVRLQVKPEFRGYFDTAGKTVDI